MQAMLIALLVVFGIILLLAVCWVVIRIDASKPVHKMTSVEEAQFEIADRDLSENQYVRDLINGGVGRLDHVPGQAPMSILKPGAGWVRL